MKWPLAALVLLAPQDRLEIPDRWVYCQTNLQVDENLDALQGVLLRASKAGYTGVMLADSKLAKLGEVPDRYLRNVKRLKRIAREAGLEIIPAVFPVGYSESILWHDPNLAEGLPVRDALFVVRGGAARPEPDPPVAFRPKWDWKDEIVGPDWTVTDPKGRNARIVQKVKVRPFRQYHVSVRVRTLEFQGSPKVNVLAGGRMLNYADLGVKPTQDWTEHHATFNSLENEQVTLYLGCWDGGTGTLAWSDAKIEETGLVNLIRRDGAPLTVRREGGEALVEGRDFERVVDPRMGSVPYNGCYDAWHEPPVIRTALPEGTRLRVSYHHATVIHSGQNMICPSEPRTVELLRDQARRVHELFGAKTYFMSHDEIRILNWDEACSRRNLDAGAIVADNVRTCTQILREVAPGCRIYVWSDVFDPHHNAHGQYYLVRGNLAGSWEGLDKDVVVAAWFYDKREESLKWFAERGHRVLVAGYYDARPENLVGWLETAKRTRNVTGVMYTTWRRKFDDLERYAEILEKGR